MKRRVFILALVLMVGAGVSTLIVTRHSRNAEAAAKRITISRDGTLPGVSPNQLSGVGIVLTPTTTTPPTSVVQAEQAAKGVYPDAIESVSLADCSIAGVDRGACYAVSLQPPSSNVTVCPEMLSQPGDASTASQCESVPAYTFEVVLVSGADASVLTAVQSNT